MEVMAMKNNDLKEKIRDNVKEKIAISNIREEFDMKNNKNKKIIYWITSSVAVFVLGFGVVIGTNILNNIQVQNKTYEIASKNELNSKDSKINQIEREDIININSYQLANQLTSIADMNIDGKWIDSDLSKEFQNLNNINFPTCLVNIRQGKLFVKSNKDDKDYSKLLSYGLTASATNGDNANVQINISIDEYAISCYWNYDDIKDKESSFINNTEVKLFMSQNSEDKTKISGIAFFEYDNYKYRIEVYKISQDEFIDIIRSIVNANQ